MRVVGFMLAVAGGLILYLGVAGITWEDLKGRFTKSE